MNSLATRLAVIFFAMATLGVEVFAQGPIRGVSVGVGRGYGWGRWYVPSGYGYGGYGYGGWGWNPGYSTVAGGYGQGMADVIRAQGAYNKSEAQARLTREEARAKHIENNKKAADTYWEMKERHRQYKEEQRRRKEERTESNRAKLEDSPPSARRRGLGADEFDPVTGKIQWPELLQQPIYEEYRRQLDELFEHRTLTGGAAGAANADAIQEATEAMRLELRNQIRSIPPSDYIAARKFIEELAFEGQS